MLDDDWWQERRKAAEMLYRAGIEPTRSSDGARPEIQKIIGPLWIIAKTLDEHGFIEAGGFDPASWKLKPFVLPLAVSNALYRWAKREYLTSGAIWLHHMRFPEDIAAHAVAFRDEGDEGRLLPAIKWLLRHRNTIHKLVYGTPIYDEQTGREEPMSINDISKWPRLADYMFALDQSLDRCLDVLRRSLIRDYLDGKLPDEVKQRTLDELQSQADSGMWPEPDRDMREIAAALGIDTSADVVPLFANDCPVGHLSEVVK
jgi:hypothetical protein